MGLFSKKKKNNETIAEKENAKELNDRRKRISQQKNHKVKKAILGDSISKTRKNAGREPVATQIIKAHKRGDIGDDLAAAALRMYSDINIDRKSTLAEEMRSRALNKEGVVAKTDNRTFAQVVKDIPNKLDTLSYEDFNKYLNGLKSIPDKVYYKRNKINTIRKYRNDLTRRYLEACEGYEEAISVAKQSIEKYKDSQNNDVEALSLTKNSLIETINYSSTLKSILDELKKFSN